MILLPLEKSVNLKGGKTMTANEVLGSACGTKDPAPACGAKDPSPACGAKDPAPACGTSDK